MTDVTTVDLPEVAEDAATINYYSDRDAATIVERTARKIVVQLDKAELLNGVGTDAPDALTFTPGGFVGHVAGRQRYRYERDPNGEKVVFTLRKNGRWVRRGDPMNGQTLTVGRRAHYYDFNF